MPIDLRRLTAAFWFLLALIAGPAWAQPLADPRVDWFSADSPHFRVHYRAGHREQQPKGGGDDAVLARCSHAEILWCWTAR